MDLNIGNHIGDIWVQTDMCNVEFRCREIAVNDSSIHLKGKHSRESIDLNY